jgi:nucleotide-binding universal stress UspA family protein
VKALVVDPEDCKWLGAEKGCDLVEHLGRHGVQVDVDKVASRGRSIPEVVLDHARRNASDLLVIGSRASNDLRKLLLGGPNRFLLMKMPVPVLISR